MNTLFIKTLLLAALLAITCSKRLKVSSQTSGGPEQEAKSLYTIMDRSYQDDKYGRWHSYAKGTDGFTSSAMTQAFARHWLSLEGAEEMSKLIEGAGDQPLFPDGMVSIWMACLRQSTCTSSLEKMKNVVLAGRLLADTKEVVWMSSDSFHDNSAVFRWLAEKKVYFSSGSEGTLRGLKEVAAAGNAERFRQRIHELSSRADQIYKAFEKGFPQGLFHEGEEEAPSIISTKEKSEQKYRWFSGPPIAEWLQAAGLDSAWIPTEYSSPKGLIVDYEMAVSVPDDALPQLLSTLESTEDVAKRVSGYAKLLLAADSGLQNLFFTANKVNVKVWNAFSQAYDDGRLLCAESKCGQYPSGAQKYPELSTLLQTVCGLYLHNECWQHLDETIPVLVDWLREAKELIGTLTVMQAGIHSEEMYPWQKMSSGMYVNGVFLLHEVLGLGKVGTADETLVPLFQAVCYAKFKGVAFEQLTNRLEEIVSGSEAEHACELIEFLKRLKTGVSTPKADSEVVHDLGASGFSIDRDWLRKHGFEVSAPETIYRSSLVSPRRVAVELGSQWSEVQDWMQSTWAYALAAQIIAKAISAQAWTRAEYASFRFHDLTKYSKESLNEALEKYGFPRLRKGQNYVSVSEVMDELGGIGTRLLYAVPSNGDKIRARASALGFDDEYTESSYTGSEFQDIITKLVPLDDFQDVKPPLASKCLYKPLEIQLFNTKHIVRNAAALDSAGGTGKDDANMASVVAHNHKDSNNGNVAMTGTFHEPIVVAKSVVFLVDVSGSMGGKLTQTMTRLDIVKTQLAKIIEVLEEDQKFDVILFNNQVNMFQESLVRADTKSKGEAVDWLQLAEAGGGTDIVKGVKKALEVSDVDAVHLLSDGETSVTVEAILQGVESPKAVPIHTVLLDTFESADYDSRRKSVSVLRGIAEATGGTFRDPLN